MAGGGSPAPEHGSAPPPGGQSSGPWRLIAFLLAVLGIVLVAITPNPPVTVAHWVQVIGGALLSGFLATYAGWHGRVRRWLAEWRSAGRGEDLLRWLKHRWAGLARWLAVAVTLSVVLALGVPSAWSFARGVAIDLNGCPPATQLRMVASPETVTTARELAAAYERWSAEQNHDCPAADIYVYSAGSDEIRAEVSRGLRAGWSEDALRQLGPRPDIWLAATSHEIADLPPEVVTADAIAFSPVVLAVPQNMLRAPAGQSPTEINRVVGDLDRRHPGWRDTFRTVVGHGVPVVRADPETSELGLLATSLLYGAPGPPRSDGPGQQAPLGPAAIEQRIDKALDDGGFPLSDTAGLLCRYRQLDPQTAVVATEQDVVRFNLGEPLGGTCLTSTVPATRLSALYPSDTRAVDLQLVRLSWSAPIQAQAAADFARWLSGESGRAALLRSGLRPPAPFAVGPVLDDSGVDAQAGYVDGPVGQDELNRTAAAYEDAQRGGRVLFAVDTSGSMATDSPPDGTRSTVAARAVTSALQGMGQRDEFGLWFFPDSAGAGHVQVVPPDSGTDARVIAEQALQSVQPAGNTPLFRTMIDAADALRPGGQDRVDAVVVLTDGEDTNSGVGPEAVSAAFAGSGVRLIVVTIGEVRCADAALGSLAARTGGQCYDAGLATLDRTFSEATDELWGAR